MPTKAELEQAVVKATLKCRKRWAKAYKIDAAADAWKKAERAEAEAEQAVEALVMCLMKEAGHGRA